jgi:hypothetical protein
MTRADFLRAMYGGANDAELAECALKCTDLPQPESLDRFVRQARLEPSRWHVAASNALSQLFGIEQRSRRL